MRLVSQREVDTERHGGGHLIWEIERSTLDLGADGSLTYGYERLAGNAGPPLRIEQHGHVLSSDSKQIEGRVRQNEFDDWLYVTIIRFDDNLLLLLEVDSHMTSELLIAPEDPSWWEQVVVADVEVTDDSSEATARDDDFLPGYAPESTSAPVDLVLDTPLSIDELERFLKRIAAQLRRLDGPDGPIDVEDLVVHEIEFLQQFANGPYQQLRKIAREKIRDWYDSADVKKRFSVMIAGFDRPTSPGGPWSIALGETTYDGEATIVFECRGWQLVDQTLVG